MTLSEAISYPGRRVYKNPPIVEALCEVRVLPKDKWDFTFPGLFNERVKDVYTGDKQRLRQVEAGIAMAGDQGSAKFDFTQPEKYRYSTSDGRGFVIVGPGSVSVHVLSPYPGWEVFGGRIEHALNAFSAVVEPEGVVRIGLRYLNRIPLPGKNANLDDFLIPTPSPPQMEELTAMTGFLMRTETAFEDDVGLITTVSSGDPSDDQLSIVLDIDVFEQWGSAAPLEMSDLPGRIRDVKARGGSVFESSITDKARSIFEGVP